MIKSGNLVAITEAVKATPYHLLRLTDPKGNILIGAARGVPREDWIKDKLASYISGPSKNPYLTLYGRETNGKYQLICEIETDQVLPTQAPVKMTNTKAEANFELLQENSRLQSKVEILQFQNNELTRQIADLQNQLEDQEQTIAEMESETVPNLSENQNMLLEFAKPLLPGLQAFAFNMLAQYLPQNQTLPNNDQPGENFN
jgi:hypothetical protein